MKSALKKLAVRILSSQVLRLRSKHKFKIIGVVGSIGKTSTKLAVAKMLERDMRVRYQEGNYNDIVSVPFVFFGENVPPLWNALSWLRIFISNERQIYSEYPYDVVVLELGTDGPKQIEQFRKYLHLDIAVVTAIAPEHMEFFGRLEDVAEEEWSVSFFADKIFANRDLCKVVPENIDHKKVIFYGREFGSEYKIENIVRDPNGFYFEITKGGRKVFDAVYDAISEVQLYAVCIASVIGMHFGLSVQKIKENMSKIKSFSGRMQKLKGIKRSTIIDDTYNASPDSMRIALDALYAYPGSGRIAILGMMNELGVSSENEHKKIGKYCNPKLLDFIVTVGSDANLYLAESARENGCTVYEAQNAKDAGVLVKEKMRDGAVILAKGSQNGVFTEEAVKLLLADENDMVKLVRQSPEWLEKKSRA